MLSPEATPHKAFYRYVHMSSHERFWSEMVSLLSSSPPIVPSVAGPVRRVRPGGAAVSRQQSPARDCGEKGPRKGRGQGKHSRETEGGKLLCLDIFRRQPGQRPSALCQNTRREPCELPSLHRRVAGVLGRLDAKLSSSRYVQLSWHVALQSGGGFSFSSLRAGNVWGGCSTRSTTMRY